MTVKMDERVDFQSRLAAPGRSPEIPASADVYGWLCGSWELDVIHYRAIDVRGRGMRGEVHAGWVLEGRAVQDVWIMPRVSERSANADTGAAKRCSPTARPGSSKGSFERRGGHDEHDND